jgi:hypothetical protein
MVVDVKLIRQAIRWGNRWIENNYQLDPYWYYGFQKGFSSIPLAITVPDFQLHRPAGYVPMGGFTECATLPIWGLETLIHERNDTGEVWEGTYQFQLMYVVGADIYRTDVCIDCKISPNPANFKSRILWVKIAKVEDIPMIFIWNTWVPCKPFPRMVLHFRTPKRWFEVTDDIRRDVGKEWTITLGDFEVPSALRYNNRITNYVAAMHYWYSSSAAGKITWWEGTPSNPQTKLWDFPGDWKERAKRIFNYLDEWGYWYNWYAPLYRYSDKEGNGIADYPDDFWVHPNAMLDCDTWSKEWVSTYRYPYWSKACSCRSLYFARVVVPEWPAWLGVRAIHLMNKYNDPFHPEDFIKNQVTGKGFTAVDWLVNGGKILTSVGYVTVNPLINCYKPGFGVHHQRWTDAVMPVCTACALAAFAELGYGFNYNDPITLKDGTVTNAKAIADDLAEILVKSQWGYPFTPGEEGKANTEYYGVVNRPDQTGGWSQYFIYQDGVVTNTYKTDWVEETTDMLIGMPPEMMLDSWVGLEPTAQCVRALQIYEYYKYKGGAGKGRFPPLLVAEDVNGDGIIDIFDVVLLCGAYGAAEGSPDYNPLCDVNGDGKIDIFDAVLLIGAYGRSSAPPERKVTIPALVRSEINEATLLTANMVSAFAAVLISMIGSAKIAKAAKH